MTEISIWGKRGSKRKEKKEIELVKRLKDNGKWDTAGTRKDWDNLQLIRKGIKNWDIIIAWDNISDELDIFRGNWNDGIYEM